MEEGERGFVQTRHPWSSLNSGGAVKFETFHPVVTLHVYNEKDNGTYAVLLICSAAYQSTPSSNALGRALGPRTEGTRSKEREEGDSIARSEQGSLGRAEYMST